MWNNTVKAGPSWIGSVKSDCFNRVCVQLIKISQLPENNSRTFYHYGLCDNWTWWMRKIKRLLAKGNKFLVLCCVVHMFGTCIRATGRVSMDAYSGSCRIFGPNLHFMTNNPFLQTWGSRPSGTRRAGSPGALMVDRSLGSSLMRFQEAAGGLTVKMGKGTLGERWYGPIMGNKIPWQYGKDKLVKGLMSAVLFMAKFAVCANKKGRFLLFFNAYE